MQIEDPRKNLIIQAVNLMAAARGVGSACSGTWSPLFNNKHPLRAHLQLANSKTTSTMILGHFQVFLAEEIVKEFFVRNITH